MNKLFIEILSSFNRTYISTITFVSFIVTIVSFFLIPEDSIKIKWIILFGSVFIILLVFIFDFAVRSYKKSLLIIPRVITARKPTKPYDSAKALLVINQNILFSSESLVSVYYKDDDYEKFVGIGYVLSIQTNGLIQILITDIFEQTNNDNNIWEKIINNNNDVLKRIIIKQSIPKHIGDILYERYN